MQSGRGDDLYHVAVSSSDLDLGSTSQLLRTSGHRSHPSLKDSASDYIREQIVSGQFPPRGKVDQDEIARALGMSRLPVREALIELAQEGFVVAIPRRGSFVVELSAADIMDHYHVYGMVAALAARHCAEHVSAPAIAELKQVDDQLNATRDAGRRAKLNFQFHRLINHASGSRQLLSILWFLDRGLPVGLFRFDPAWTKVSKDHHGTILAALTAHDPDAAAAILEQHFHEAGEYTVKSLEAAGYWTPRD